MLSSNSSNDTLTTEWWRGNGDNKRMATISSDKHMYETLHTMLETVTSLILMRHMLCHSLAPTGSFELNSSLYDSELVHSVDTTISALRECIDQHMDRLPLSETKLSVIHNNKQYFESAAYAKMIGFKELEFINDPRGYLDGFVPSYVVDACTKALNWRPFMVLCPVPLIGYFVQHDLAAVTKWEDAVAMFDAVFKSSLPDSRLRRHKLALSDIEDFGAILGYARFVCPKSPCNVGWLASVCTATQQHTVIALLNQHNIGCIGKFDFHGLQ